MGMGGDTGMQWDEKESNTRKFVDRDSVGTPELLLRQVETQVTKETERDTSEHGNGHYYGQIHSE